MTNILIVDDDALMCRMYETKFKTDGYNVSIASDGEQGLSKVREEKPDIVLLDVMMPKMNGLEMLKKLKADKNIKDTPVILLSNVGESEDINKGLEMGAVAYMVKASYTPTQVVQKVKEILAGYKRDIPEPKVSIKEEED